MHYRTQTNPIDLSRILRLTPPLRQRLIRAFAIIAILGCIGVVTRRADALAKNKTGTESQKENTYTITTVMRILKPVSPSDMNDDFQTARVLAEDRASYTMEITYFPLKDMRAKIGENPRWKQDDAGMRDYLRPTPSENWDPAMQQHLTSRLKADGINPDCLTDRALVEKVSNWALQHSHFTDRFASWFVAFPNGKPVVPTELRPAFDSQKPDPAWTDQRMFDQEVLGKQMYYQGLHGSCTSTSVYLATIFRALGIPTRIVACIPPADPNDKRQMDLLLNGIHHYGVRATIEQGLATQGGWCNHLFNEVYVGHRWVRLNYNRLGQNILDKHYFGLLTHILTFKSLSEVGLSKTWGTRYAKFDTDADVGPRLTSVNPYMLIKIQDHFGKYARIANPKIQIPELKAVTIIGAYGKDSTALPADVRSMAYPTDFLICIKEWLPDQDYGQLRRFFKKASHRFVLKAPGHPDIPASMDGSNFNFSDGKPSGVSIQGFVLHITPEDWSNLFHGIPYSLEPQNTSATYYWKVAPQVTVIAP